MMRGKPVTRLGGGAPGRISAGSGALLGVLSAALILLPLLVLRVDPLAPPAVVPAAPQTAPGPPNFPADDPPLFTPDPIPSAAAHDTRPETAARVSTPAPAPQLPAPDVRAAAEALVAPTVAPLDDAAVVAAAQRESQDPPPNGTVTQPTSGPASPLTPAARQAAVRRFGGSPETEDAVELGLAWLVAHQDADGGWNRFEFSRHCPAGDRCPGPALQRRDDSLRTGVTALALLALLGAGYTDQAGPYREPVARAVAALLRVQDADGGFLGDDAMAGYNNTLATLALAEYAALTGNPRVRPALQAAVRRLAATQQPLGGWDYLARPDAGRNDTSITGWAVQALASAGAAGVQPPPGALIRAATHFRRAAGGDGRTWYSDAGTGFKIDPRTLRPVHRFGPAMTAVGVTSEVLLGWRVDAPLPSVQRAWLLTQPPSQFTMQRDPTNLHDYYYWYYGTLAMFQAGGDDWQRWNAALRDALLPLQERRTLPSGGRTHAFGSWPPYGHGWGKWGRMGGRVYSTAIAVLTLEVYYRHPPAYLEPQRAIRARDWIDYLSACEPRERPAAVAILAQARCEVAEPVLVQVLRGPERELAISAAAALADLGSPLGRGLLREVRDALPPLERAGVERALAVIDELDALGLRGGTVRYVGERGRFSTVEVPGAYVGLEVGCFRDQRAVGRGVVIQRFDGRDTAVVEWSAVSGEIGPGDVVRELPRPGG